MALTNSLTSTQKRLLQTGMQPQANDAATIADVRQKALVKAASTAVAPKPASQSYQTATSLTKAPTMNSNPTPTELSELIRNTLNQRIAATNSSYQPKIEQAFNGAMQGYDMTQEPGYDKLGLGALLSRDRMKGQGMLQEAQNLSGLQSAMAGRVDNSLATAGQIFAERNQMNQQEAEAKRQAELDRQNAQRQAELDKRDAQQMAIDNARQNSLLKLQAMTLQTNLDQNSYQAERDKIEDNYQQMKNKIEVAKMIETDPFTGGLTDASRLMLQNLGMDTEEEGVNTLLNSAVPNMPAPSGLTAETGTPVMAFVGGRVVGTSMGKVRAPGSKGKGEQIQVQDANGAVHTYANLQGFYVKEGDLVAAGQPLGLQAGEVYESYPIAYKVQSPDGKAANADKYFLAFQDSMGIPKAYAAEEQAAPLEYDQQAVDRLIAMNPTENSPAGIILADWSSGISPAKTLAKITNSDTTDKQENAKRAAGILQEIYGATAMYPATTGSQALGGEKTLNDFFSEISAGDPNGVYSVDEKKQMASEQYKNYLGQKAKENVALTPDQQQAMDYLNQKSQVTLDNIDQAMGLISWDSTGAVGLVSAYMPGTPAYALNQKLVTIRANVLTKELATMRQASPTGASGMGALSDREGAILQAAFGSLDQGQSPQDLKNTLETIRGSLNRLQQGIQAERGGKAASVQQETNQSNTEWGQPPEINSIKVQELASGQYGWLPANEFNPQQYKIIN